MEAPTASAEAAANWLDDEIGKWSAREKVLRINWKDLSIAEKEAKANAWMKALKANL